MNLVKRPASNVKDLMNSTTNSASFPNAPVRPNISNAPTSGSSPGGLCDCGSKATHRILYSGNPIGYACDACTTEIVSVSGAVELKAVPIDNATTQNPLQDDPGCPSCFARIAKCVCIKLR